MTLVLERVVGTVSADLDETWLREIYASCWAPMVRLAALLLGSSDQAEEIVQDAVVALHARRSQFETTGQAHAYLRTSVVNRCRSAHRHRAVVQRYRPDQDEVTGPEAVATQRDIHDRVMVAMRSLPQRQQEVLILRYYAELHEVEIADSLGISRGAVKSHAHRGLQALRAALAEMAEEG